MSQSKEEAILKDINFCSRLLDEDAARVLITLDPANNLTHHHFNTLAEEVKQIIERNSILFKVNTQSTTKVGPYPINGVSSSFQDNCLSLHLADVNDVRRISRYLQQKYKEQVISHLLQKQPSEKRIHSRTKDYSIKLYFKPELHICSKEEAIKSLQLAIDKSKTETIEEEPVIIAEIPANTPLESNALVSTTTNAAASMQIEPAVALTQILNSPLIKHSLFRVGAQRESISGTASRQQLNTPGYKRTRDEDDENISVELHKKFKFEPPTPLVG